MRMSDLAVLTKRRAFSAFHTSFTRLEKRGYVRREPDPSDGRYTNAVLTEAGYEHVVGRRPWPCRDGAETLSSMGSTPPSFHALRQIADPDHRPHRRSRLGRRSRLDVRVRTASTRKSE